MRISDTIRCSPTGVPAYFFPNYLRLLLPGISKLGESLWHAETPGRDTICYLVKKSTSHALNARLIDGGEKL